MDLWCELYWLHRAFTSIIYALTSTYRYSIIGKQLNEKQQQEPPNLQERVNIPLRNAEEGFSTTFDEMLLINEKRPNLKT